MVGNRSPWCAEWMALIAGAVWSLFGAVLGEGGAVWPSLGVDMARFEHF